MKTLLGIIAAVPVMIAVGFLAAAAVRKRPTAKATQTPAAVAVIAAPTAFSWRVADTNKHRLREFNGRLYDLALPTAEFARVRASVNKDADKSKSLVGSPGALWELENINARVTQSAAFLLRTTPFHVRGEVMSVHDDGLLIRTGEEEGPLTIVFLKNHPESAEKFDGSKINAFAFQAGKYRYQSVAGATKTVPLYNYGKPVTQSTNRFATYELVDAKGWESSTRPFEEGRAIFFL